MADAQVRDLERLEHFLHQLHGFQERLTKQSDESRIELARATRWIEQEAPDYWHQQDQLARRRWVEAREALLRCEAVTRADDKPACSELRKKLDICTQRVKLCEYKLRQAKQFQLAWQQELQAIQTKIQQLIDVTESRLPIARHHLDKLLEPLRRYVSMAAPSAQPPTSSSSNNSPVAGENNESSKSYTSTSVDPGV